MLELCMHVPHPPCSTLLQGISFLPAKSEDSRSATHWYKDITGITLRSSMMLQYLQHNPGRLTFWLRRKREAPDDAAEEAPIQAADQARQNVPREL